MTHASLAGSRAWSSLLMVLLPGMCVISANLGSLWSQSDGRTVQARHPSFDVASIRQNKSGDVAGNFATSPGGYTISNYSLLRLISVAYQMQEFQIAGGPSWINTDRFDVIAKASEGSRPSRQDLLLMLQSLLAERFHLQVRREKRLGPVYSLVVARRDGALGEHLRPVVDCTVAPLPIRQDPDKCSMRYERGGVHMRGMSLDPLVKLVMSIVRRTVVDRTRLTGGFDYDLVYSLDPQDSTAPSISTALQDQLGLRLVSEKGPVDTLVIEQADHPTPN